MIKKFLNFISILLIFSCSIEIPFDITTEYNNIEIPNTMGMYVEKLIESPTNTQNQNINFTSLTLNYIITNNTILSGEINIYISLKTNADNQKSNSTKIISVNIPANQIITGATSNDILISAIKQKQFVIGLENASLSISGTSYKINFTYNINAKGRYKLY